MSYRDIFGQWAINKSASREDLPILIKETCSSAYHTVGFHKFLYYQRSSCRNYAWDDLFDGFLDNLLDSFLDGFLDGLSDGLSDNLSEGPWDGPLDAASWTVHSVSWTVSRTASWTVHPVSWTVSWMVSGTASGTIFWTVSGMVFLWPLRQSFYNLLTIFMTTFEWSFGCFGLLLNKNLLKWTVCTRILLPFKILSDTFRIILRLWSSMQLGAIGPRSSQQVMDGTAFFIKMKRGDLRHAH